MGVVLFFDYLFLSVLPLDIIFELAAFNSYNNYFLLSKTYLYSQLIFVLQSKEDLYAAYKTDKFLTQLIAKSATYEFTNANKIYVSDVVPVRQCVVTGFPEEIEIKGFNTNPEAARVYINDWVANTTHQMIKDLIPPGTVDRTTDLVLVNAAYFKGMWENKFNPELTKQEVFYVNPSKQIMVDMMHLEGTFKHGK